MIEGLKLITTLGLSLAACQSGVSDSKKPSVLNTGSVQQSATFAQASQPPAPEIDVSRLTTDQVFSVLTSGSSNVSQTDILRQRINQFGQITFDKLYKALNAAITDEVYIFDGIVRIAGAKTRLSSDQVKMMKMAAGFGNVAEFWRIQHVNPETASASDLRDAIKAASSYYNGAFRQVTPHQQQIQVQNALDQFNQANAQGTVSPDEDRLCGTSGHLPCAPNEQVIDSKRPNEESYEACQAPTGLALKHKCTMAIALGGGLMVSKPEFAKVGAAIAIAGLVCAAESSAPTAAYCSPSNTFSVITSPFPVNSQ